MLTLHPSFHQFEERSKVLQDQLHDMSSKLEKVQSEKAKLELSTQTLETDQVRLAKELEAGKVLLTQKETRLAEASEKIAQLQQLLEKVSRIIASQSLMHAHTLKAYSQFMLC